MEKVINLPLFPSLELVKRKYCVHVFILARISHCCSNIVYKCVFNSVRTSRIRVCIILILLFRFAYNIADDGCCWEVCATSLSSSVRQTHNERTKPKTFDVVGSGAVRRIGVLSAILRVMVLRQTLRSYSAFTLVKIFPPEITYSIKWHGICFRSCHLIAYEIRWTKVAATATTTHWKMSNVHISLAVTPDPFAFA